MDRITAEQIRRNELSRLEWQRYASHRERVTETLCHALAPRPQRRLCVLGAGNCNDLDLQRLLGSFRELHLVDLDAQALTEGVARQGCREHSQIQLHAEVDLTGIASLLAGLSPDTPSSDKVLLSCLQLALNAPPPSLPGPFDVVASVGLMTQLFDAIVLTLGERHERFLELLQRVRTRHLRLLFEWLAPGGAAVLVTEVVSSDSAPELTSIPEHDLTAAVVRLINERNFFTGTNPDVLRSILETDPHIAPQLDGVQLLPGLAVAIHGADVRCVRDRGVRVGWHALSLRSAAFGRNQGKPTPPGLPRWPAGLCDSRKVAQKPLDHRGRPGGGVSCRIEKKSSDINEGRGFGVSSVLLSRQAPVVLNFGIETVFSAKLPKLLHVA